MRIESDSAMARKSAGGNLLNRKDGMEEKKPKLPGRKEGTRWSVGKDSIESIKTRLTSNQARGGKKPATTNPKPEPRTRDREVDDACAKEAF